MTETARSEQDGDSDAGQSARTPAMHIDHGNDVPTMPLSQGASQNEADRLRVPRIALLADSFLEVNGLALTCRQLHDFAYRQRFPFLTLLAGPNTEFREEGTTCLAQLGFSRASLPIDGGLVFDPVFWRHYRRVKQALENFRPDLVHFTALSNCGILGAIVAKRLGIPTVASWHTNVHEFGALRLAKATSFLPDRLRKSICRFLESFSLAGILEFYRPARLLFAPNEELATLLETRTGKPTRIMRRGVNSHLFSPEKRNRTDDTFVLGFVGRLAAEKNVRFLPVLEQALIAAGRCNFKFAIVGQGSEKPWLKKNMRFAEFPGVLEGEDLARAYANFDLFVFPSYSDTYGNVIQESHASGVPAVVTNRGGPKFLVKDGVNGFVARNDQHFVECVFRAMDPQTDFAKMKTAARVQGEQASWDRVFEKVYSDYEMCLDMLRGSLTTDGNDSGREIDDARGRPIG